MSQRHDHGSRKKSHEEDWVYNSRFQQSSRVLRSDFPYGRVVTAVSLEPHRTRLARHGVDLASSRLGMALHQIEGTIPKSSDQPVSIAVIVTGRGYPAHSVVHPKGGCITMRSRVSPGGSNRETCNMFSSAEALQARKSILCYHGFQYCDGRLPGSFTPRGAVHWHRSQ